MKLMWTAATYRHASSAVNATLSALAIIFAGAMIVAPTGNAQTADLSIAKSAPTTAHVGSPLTYTLAAKNNGPSDDTNVAVTDSIPFGTTYKSAAASQGTCQGTSTVKCTLGTLANAASATVTIVVVPGATGTITNTGRISGDLTDPAPTNNSSSASTTVMPACTYSISPQEQTFASSGGTGTISVTSSDSSCTWNATRADSWITITGGGTGTGNGNVTFSVLANNGATTRTGSIHAAGFTFTVVEGGKSAPIQFQVPVSYPLNGAATAAVASDFNQDGRIDVAAAVSVGGAGQIEVLLSTGNGTFGQPSVYNLSSSSSQLITADVNADGYPDLIALVSGAFAVLLNNGNGTFAAPVYYGSGGYNLAIGDFYQDGRIHIAAANGNLIIYRNLGNGQFVQATIVNNVYATWVSVADLNGDGFADMAVASSSNGYYTVLNNGDGTFTPSALLQPGTNYVTAADLNGDGMADLILSVYGQTSLSIALNQGNGTFAPPTPALLGSATVAGPTTVADIDGDGAPDLLLPDGQNIAILRNVGAGYFAPPVFASGSSLGYNPAPFALADMNKDGRLDIVAPETAANGNSFLIFLGQTTQACKYAVTPNNIKVGSSSGATGTLSVTAGSSCSWTAASSEPWITITSGASGKGTGTVGYSVAANTDVAREGTITAAEQTVPVTQVGGLPILQFGTPSTISVGSSMATAVAMGDFNKDGKQDLAVAVSGGQIEVLLGKGDGTFAVPVAYNVNSATQLIVADVNADGFPDLLALVSGNFAVLLNNGNGTFAAPTYYGGANFSNIAVGDFYRDGRVHVAAAYGNGVYIFQNLGNGEFVHTQTVGGTAAAWWVAVADFNGDGYDDLAMTSGNTANSYSIMLNNGNGTFAAQVTTTTSFNALFVTAADLNGDGLPDLVLSNDAGNGNGNVIGVLLNQGNATFGTPVTYAVPPNGPIYGSPLVADLDGDGRPDLMIPNATGIAVLRNLGSGVFEPADLLLTGGPVYPYTTIATIDLKGDGHLSVVTPDPVSGSNAALLFTNTTPQVCSYAVKPSSVQLTSAAAATGTLAVTAASTCTWTATSNESWIAITAGATGTGNGTVNYAASANTDVARVGVITAAEQTVPVTQVGGLPILQFGTPSTISVGSSMATAVAMGDFNKDGKQDLAVAVSGGQIEVLLGKGDGTFAVPVAYNVNSATQLIVADVNADGFPDLLALVSGNFAVLLNNGNGTFAAPTYYGGANFSNIAVGDFYRDGRVHVAAAYGNGVYIFQNLGNGEFVHTQTVGGTAAAWWVAVADFNGDGYDDLAMTSGNTANSYSIMLNNGNGTFAAQVTTTTSFNALFVTAADLNGDGLPDLVLSNDAGNGNGNVIGVLLNQGNATFGTPVTYAVPPNGPIYGSPLVADLDGDGRPDLMIPNATGIAVLRNLGSGVFEPADLLLTGGPVYPYTTIATIDLKGDGHLSVVTPDPVSGSNAALLFTNTTPQVCSYAVKPSSVQLTSAAAATGTLAVTAASTCTWTATSNESWIAITAGATGTGNGTVNYAASANTDVARVGVITAAEQPVTFTQAGGSPTLQFSAPTNISVGSSMAAAVAVGDFNKDGKQDLAVAISGGQVVVLLGKGDGTFAAPVAYNVNSATQLVVADVNADGFPDLLALVSGSFAVLLNNGNGTFAAPAYYGNGAGLINIAVGDFYRDGRVHVAASELNNVYIFQNLGNGEFVQTLTVGGAAAWWVAVADFNGDGYADLAVTSGNTANSYSIMLNNGNGTFAAPVTTTTSFNANSVTAADLDGDGFPDLVLSNGAANGSGNVIGVLLNQRNATFGTPVTYAIPPSGPIEGSTLIADLDGDGRPDLMIPNQTGIAVMRNLGSGVFEPEDLLLTGGSIYPYTTIATIDLKGDGHLSVVTPDPVSGSNAALLFTNTTPQVCSYAVTPSSVRLTTAAATGKLTVTAASTCSWKAVPTEPFITITGSSTGQGNGTVNYAVTKNTDTARLGTIAIKDAAATITQASAFPPIVDLPSQLGDLGSAVTGFVCADFNRDGLTDYAVATADGTISVFLATTAGQFATPVHYTFGSGIAPIVADVNSDGYPDLVILSGGIGVAINKGDGTFSAPTYYPLPNPGATGMTVGDFNQNGHIDLAAISVQAFGNSPLLSVFMNDGTGHFTVQSPVALATGASWLTATDINNDGYVDLVIANSNTLGTRTVSVLLNQKNGKFTLQSPLDIVAFSLVAADLNGDGYPDLVINNAPDLQVFLGIGDGTFGPPASYAFPNAGYGLPVITDFDGNGKPDVVVPANDALAFFRNTGKGILELQDFTSTANGLTMIAAGDLNDDGKIDILANAGPTQPTPTAYWLFANETKQVCGFSVTPNNILLPTSGVATEQLIVKASSRCSWQAVSHSPWISIQSGGTGTGNGTVMLSAAANAATTGRVARMTVAGIAVIITQPGQ